MSEGSPADWASGASDGGFGITPPAPQAEPAPAHPAQSQDSAAPRDPAPAEAGGSGQRQGAQPALPFSWTAATAYPGPQISGLAAWMPRERPSSVPYAPGSNLAGVSPGMPAPGLPGYGPLPSLALDCSAQSQNRTMDLFMQHLPFLAELRNLSRRMEDLLSLVERRMPEPAPQVAPAPAVPSAPPAPPRQLREPRLRAEKRRGRQRNREQRCRGKTRKRRRLRSGRQRQRRRQRPQRTDWQQRRARPRSAGQRRRRRACPGSAKQQRKRRPRRMQLLCGRRPRCRAQP
ncbi:transcription initiation factor TFIID subunit 4-like [Corvus cornix cornix]|uniref:transcription initiation factor TFIID subunit 4-like n=1 Tax=Corvus cornix cornix TaxID=932674 RepID=UPI0019514D21|nr:transcription initiation factor TFIID subunit 4-like [Corvus cornix cornix]